MIVSINPMNGEPIRSYEETPSRELDSILQNAHRAWLTWRMTGFTERARPMRQTAVLLKRDRDSFATLMAEEMGKPITQGRAEIEKCAWACEYFAANAERFLFPEEVRTEASRSYVAFEPLGVILAIMPWNFPFWQVFRCAAPALMAGNAIILKHASNVPGCALAIEKVFVAAGFPRGLFQTVLIGSDAVKGLIHSPGVSAVTLTGSTPAGRAVAAQAGEALKKAVLELGGSDPYLILEDADLDLAAKACATARLVNSGQSCIAAKRFLVVESISKDFQERFVAQMRDQVLGNPLEETTTVGPLAREDLRTTLHGQVESSLRDGAKLLLGGSVPNSKGWFYPPTVLAQVQPGMKVFDEETFGPVAALVSVRNESEAVELANASPFGLGAAVFTQDTDRGQSIARQLAAGCCFINDFVRSDPRMPFGGLKDSGFGRELGEFGIREFVNIKTVSVK
ncbi:MAG: NAD-dependent succinate-semialdehyde dehydrogenase [Verrucomicrobiota bacterium]